MITIPLIAAACIRDDVEQVGTDDQGIQFSDACKRVFALEFRAIPVPPPSAPASSRIAVRGRRVHETSQQLLLLDQRPGRQSGHVIINPRSTSSTALARSRPSKWDRK